MADELVQLCPLAGWSMATLPEQHVMVQVDYVTSERERQELSVRTLRLAMTCSQAEEFAQAIARAAKAPHIPQPPSDARN